jgi:autotransporter-associated beta strand protein
LVFGDTALGDTALQKTNTNDFSSGTLFNTVVISGSGYVINGNDISLFGGITAQNLTGSNTFSPDLTLLNAVSIVAANTGGTLVLGGVDTAGLVGQTGIQGTSALTVDGAGTVQIDGVVSGHGGVYKQGSGTLVLTGSNTFEGMTTVQQGVVNIRSDTALGTTNASTFVAAGAALQV